jgi:hypothetical protein
MHDTLAAFAKWLEGTPWGLMTRESIWAYPFVQLIHFTGLSIWLGTNFALDLRLFSGSSACLFRWRLSGTSSCSAKRVIGAKRAILPELPDLRR